MSGQTARRPFVSGLIGSLRARLGREGSADSGSLPVRDFVNVNASHPSRVMGFDQPLVWLTISLLVMGLIMVYSATIALPDSPRFANYAPMHFFTRHLMSLVMAVAVGAVVTQIPMSTWERWAPWLFVASLVLLILVLIPHVGKVVYGARRWLPLGFMNFQPSELAKLAIVLYASDYMVRKMDVKEHFFRAVTPMAVAVGVVGLLLLAEPDMGAFMVIATIAMAILFLGGVNGKMFTLITGVLLGAFMLMISLSPWRRERIFAYLDPWSEKNALGKAYQLTHSLIAFGRGEIFGEGLGSSLEKLHYLPEAHTDFLLAVIGEELGFIGVAVVIIAFFWLVVRLFNIGRQAIALDRVFSGLVAQGVAVWMGGQGFINMGVNLGVLPTKGLTLPLMSFGGSGVMLNCIALAICLRVDMENRQLMRGGRA
ncbi:putative lipid II flippase FtsW [Aquabacterium sp.]|jgi:cell division protein FtsW|uniref:putative lipid II flippase FtsW n=1 Tax=Aquabacterium sp. TaxID=1872578 RepID=UPI0025C1115F|nr:putative lipid II flippase FtsW [Aquabacterium sp.]